MRKCVRGVSIALFALLTVVSVCPAAEKHEKKKTKAASAKATAVAEAPAATSKPFALPGHASFGGGLGLSRFMADADYVKSRDGGGSGRDLWGTRDAAMRFAFAAQLRYAWSNHFRWQVSPGFLWTGYKDQAVAPFHTDYLPNDSLMGNYLTLMMPAQAQIQLLQHGKTWLVHEGFGGGVYRLWIEQDRHVVKDPITKRLHTGFYPGFTAEIGAERILKAMPSVSLEWTAASHYVFAERDEQFPSGFNSNLWTIEARFGANYWFTPGAPKKTGSSARK
jgi:Outer membrane protein beta-barrel domain